MRIKSYRLAVLALLVMAGIVACSIERPVSERKGHFTVLSGDGLRLRYEVAGQGDTALVFVHCWTCNRSFWDAQFDEFAKDYRVVRLDLAGHGESDGGRKNHTIKDFAADVAAVVNDLKLQRVVLVGHSMGGPVSVEAEKILGDRVIGVVGVDTFYTGFPYPDTDQAIKAFVEPFEQDFVRTAGGMVRSMFPPTADPALIGRVSKVIESADRDMAVEAMYDLFRWSRSEAPTALPALGERLRNINAEPADKTVVQQASVVRIANTGHFLHMEKPLEFNQKLRALIRGFETR